MGSSGEDVRSRVLRAFKKFGFFIFTKEIYSEVSRVIKEAGIWQMVKIRSLGGKGGYFVVEPDERLFLAACRDRCVKNGVVDEFCLAKCEEERMAEVVNEIIRRLEGSSSG